QTKILTKNIMCKLEDFSLMREHYSTVFLPVTAIVVGRLLNDIGALSKELTKSSTHRFLETGRIEDPQDISLIFQSAHFFIEDKGKQ
ncbi:hypothetical protein LJC25_05020, partial [Bacteroidales bacterium OttesenSCG-928-K03]|nr:hypothetical protein [Bacteroidales bacterium OttesenSCG-928-K03]